MASFEAKIIQLTASQFWLGFAVIAALSAWSFFRMSRWYHHARMIENVPTAKIRSAAQGYVELIGRTKWMDGPVIISPLTSTTCVWYSYKIEEKVTSHQSNGKFQSSWRLVDDGKSEELFLLEDETGICVIDPDEADVITERKKTWYKRHVIPPRRYTEQLILQDDRLYAIGLFKTLADIENRKESEQVAHLLRQWKNDPNQLIHLYDHNRDGDLSPDEWEQARSQAESQVRLQHGNREKHQQLNVLSASPQKDQAFILSTTSEQTLVKKYKWRASGSLLLFFIFGSVAVWAFNIRLGI